MLADIITPNVEVAITDHLQGANRYCSPSRKPVRERHGDYKAAGQFRKIFVQSVRYFSLRM
jgi:hypothetical protein